MPSTEAVMGAVPGATAVTRPLVATVAIDGFALAHVMVLPLTAAPDASRGTAVNRTVSPTSIAAEPGVIAIVATFGVITGALGVDASPPPPQAAAVKIATALTRRTGRCRIRLMTTHS
jgi:hypothetical protein